MKLKKIQFMHGWNRVASLVATRWLYPSHVSSYEVKLKESKELVRKPLCTEKPL